MMKKLIKIPVLVLFVILVFTACKKEKRDNPTNGKTTAVFNPTVDYGTITDQDGNVYKTVTIGTQTWMAENLRTTTYNDGTTIPNITGIGWTDLTTGAYCNYNNTTNTDTIATFGRLYNWFAVNTGKLAPKGWHVPTDAEWITLTNYLGGDSITGYKLKEIGTKHWRSPNTRATNEVGFTALPGGFCIENSLFGNIGNIAFWWSTTELGNTIYANCRAISYNSSNLNSTGFKRLFGLSVRCVRD